MRFTETLPTPSVEALAHSRQLTMRIHTAIAANGGSIPFREFMRMALYEPGLGYYVAGLRKFGAGGDFITAPELSPLFSRCLANQCAQVLNELGGGDVLELGAGSGIMAADMLQHLDSRGCLPRHYWILEVSPDLQARQYQTLQARVPQWLERIGWLTGWPGVPLHGVVVGNEVLDAMPVELFTRVGSEQVIRQVGSQGDGFALLPVAGNYTSEYNPALPGWMLGVAGALEAGVVLLVDYGYEQHDYYHPERSQGTLVCHYQHRVHADPLLYPGLQDITASVDFTALAEAGMAAGLELAGYTTQAEFLINNGLEAVFMQALQAKPQTQYALAQQVRTLTLPAEMGERFRVMAFGKGVSLALQGFRVGDRRHRL